MTSRRLEELSQSSSGFVDRLLAVVYSVFPATFFYRIAKDRLDHLQLLLEGEDRKRKDGTGLKIAMVVGIAPQLNIRVAVEESGLSVGGLE